MSFIAKKNLENGIRDSFPPENCFLIDVIKNKDLSESLAKIFSVRHESPQLFLVHNAEVIWYGSHSSVNADNILLSLSRVKEN